MYDYLLMNIANVFITVVIYNFSIDVVNAAGEGEACASYRQEGHLTPNLEDCGSFLICNNDRYLKTKCPKSLHFDPKRKTCNFPDRVSFFKCIQTIVSLRIQYVCSIFSPDFH